MLKFNGIPLLVGLLQSPSSHVCQTALAALRNLSFKNNNSKEEIQRCGGISEAVALLRDTDSVEMQKQLTGVCVNLNLHTHITIKLSDTCVCYILILLYRAVSSRTILCKVLHHEGYCQNQLGH